MRKISRIYQKVHRKARLKWALHHQSRTIEDWKQIIRLDATKLNKFNSDEIN